MNGSLFVVLFWSGPIGLGIFLVCLGGMIYLLAKANEISKRVKREYKGKK
jgi:hypothetical protein